MLENLSQLVRENVQDSVINNQAIPNEHNENVIQAASGSIFDSLKSQFAGGNLGGLADMFNHGNTDGASATQQASGSFADKLAGLGIDSATAQNLASSIIPNIMSKLTQKTADPNDSSFNIKDILGNISGADGKFDLSDVTSMFTGAQGDTNGGSVVDKIKGMFD